MSGDKILYHVYKFFLTQIRVRKDLLACAIFSTVLATTVLVIVPGNAFASTRSEMFRTQAVLDLYDGKHEAALNKLNQSLDADPQDFTSLYYRGIVHSRMGNFKLAIKDIELAMKNGAGFEGLHFELGFAYYLQKDLNQSRSALETAEHTYPEHAPAKYYLGLVYYQQQEYMKSVPLLEKAVELDPTFGASSAYLIGDSYVKSNHPEKARVVLVKALEQYPDSVYYNATRALLDSIERAADNKPFSLDLTLGYAYDDNVGLFPDDQILAPGEKKSDQRLFIGADARYKLINSDGRLVRVGYRASQSQHSELSAYDVFSHVLSLDLREKRKAFTWGLRYEFSKASLDGEDFQEAQTVMPNLMIKHGASNMSLLTLQVRDIDYRLAGIEGRSSYLYELLYRYYWLTGANNSSNFYAGARAATENAADNEYDSRSWLLEVGASNKLSVGTFSTYLLYGTRKFAESLSSREDKHAEVNAEYELPLIENLDLLASALYVNNPSTDDVYQYNRLVVSLAMRWRI